MGQQMSWGFPTQRVWIVKLLLNHFVELNEALGPSQHTPTTQWYSKIDIAMNKEENQQTFKY